MMFRNSRRVFSSNFSLCYKLFLYRFIIALIMIAIGVAVFLPNLLPVVNDLNELGVFNMVNDVFAKITAFQIEAEAIKENIANIVIIFKDVLVNHASRLINTYIATGVFVLLAYFLTSLADVPTSEVLFGSMELQAKFYFSASFMRKIKTALKYTLLNMCVFLPIDLVIFAVTILILFAFKGAWLVLSPFFATLVFSFLYALRLTFGAAWLPVIIAEEKGVCKAFKESLNIVSERFGRIFSTMLIGVLLWISATVVFGISTFGVALLLIGIMANVFYRAFGFVLYFGVKGKKYYVDYETIIIPKKLRDKEQNFIYDLNDD